ncbi:ABC transporter substrate-binding protein [Sinorhizobium meliloti]|uniref:ABC transporter substrate-binding protein n=1 Tax=Rhizobium meliloti TaxID=382 RepID=UPI00237FDFC0|nr:ABC transporter substrate-binding protein [Sinorhizobium meliloti]MDE3819662.1 ABC transporter substrate-binding protein [Sinorhizobium meliloti]MDW9984232.1 ABC transporter substrate-binding protein [Sinorhizobium meliloti]MDX0269933.1 ABC transporter substrate-binding protein [Sinorhizobium meliloti]
MIELSVAIGDYDRNRPLFDGRVKIDGAKPVMMALSPEEMFFRAMRHEAFDVCELSLSSHTLRTSRGDAPYTAIPAFVSRAFRHTGIIVRADSGITEPGQLKGRRVGLPEWQLTANVWIRALLEEEYGVRPQDIHWVRGGLEEPGRVEKVKLDLPAGVKIEEIGPNDTLRDMLSDGRIDAFIGPRAPTNFVPGNPDLRWLFADPTAEAERYFKKTRIFPIMHVIGIRKSLAERHPWLPVAVYKAFVQSKAVALEQLSETSATKVTLPFVEEQLRRARSLMGDDYWPYGIEKSRHVLEYFLEAHHRQGISKRRVAVEELFHPSAMESYVI